ncbi:isocitrate lyase/PEP mutase family protein [Pseudonocardia sp. TRM90224]|uniref:isocitrate lyase/PEP mutase family protein n=1 Tax=Pseudonocardia sp. TRM90224 TaxID=2812678 RepID=UPI001E5DDB9C|nr:isocitrate lyase/PEP mutase family protein [Pseudonocardia sp. TRM90224]
MAEPVSAPARLRALLAGEAPLVAPGAYDGLSARLVEQAGFDAVYMTGFGASASLLGRPDVGLLAGSEMADNARRIVAAVDVPVIADADTGYGNAINVLRTVALYEQAGVAALQLEDQVTPKKCGHMSGKELITRAEMVGKVEAAVAARRDPELVIIARTDAVAVEGLDAALDRARAYADAGADLLFVEAPVSEDEIARIARELRGVAPLVFNWAEGGRTPPLSLARITELGFALVTPGLGRAGKPLSCPVRAGKWLSCPRVRNAHTSRPAVTARVGPRGWSCTGSPPRAQVRTCARRHQPVHVRPTAAVRASQVHTGSVRDAHVAGKATFPAPHAGKVAFPACGPPAGPGSERTALSSNRYGRKCRSFTARGRPGGHGGLLATLRSCHASRVVVGGRWHRAGGGWFLQAGVGGVAGLARDRRLAEEVGGETFLHLIVAVLPGVVRLARLAFAFVHAPGFPVRRRRTRGPGALAAAQRSAIPSAPALTWSSARFTAPIATTSPPSSDVRTWG